MRKITECTKKQKAIQNSAKHTKPAKIDAKNTKYTNDTKNDAKSY